MSNQDTLKINNKNLKKENLTIKYTPVQKDPYVGNLNLLDLLLPKLDIRDFNDIEEKFIKYKFIIFLSIWSSFIFLIIFYEKYNFILHMGMAIFIFSIVIMSYRRKCIKYLKNLKKQHIF